MSEFLDVINTTFLKVCRNLTKLEKSACPFLGICQIYFLFIPKAIRNNGIVKIQIATTLFTSRHPLLVN